MFLISTGGGGFTPLYGYENIIGGSGGGGGGTGTAYAWDTQNFPQAAPFLSGLTLALSRIPSDPDSVFVDYNGRILSGTEYSILGSTITILFADPDVPFYDSVPYFQVKFSYVP